ncbi:OmpA family protein [Reyranella aquatilis]|uniref:OmpA family protein n=1 Tax=Reyranella aquatilis TaxID=2035356 RepID=UPI001E37EE6A|nr:OmpA family protein [Reyranella aquatilis]
MPPSSVAARSLALAVLGVGAAAFAARGQNVTAFNPYSGLGLPGGPPSQSASPAAAPAVTAPMAPSGQLAGPAFNPWTLPAPPPLAPQPSPSSASASVRSPATGTNLPPPPGRIASRVVAVPELTTNRARPRVAQKASAAPRTRTVAAAAPKSAPPTAGPPVQATPPASKPIPTATTPVATAAPAAPKVAPPAGADSTAPAAPEPKMAALAPQPPAPARVPLTVSLVFPARSAELSDTARAELDRLIKSISDRALRQVELKSFAANGEADSRKVSLARALNVRTYLIDKGVKSKIEIGTFSSSDGNERVEIVVPNT